MLWAFIFAFFSTFGFSILLHVPKRHLLYAALTGALGWLTYTWFIASGSENILACFGGSCVVALVSELFARLFKDAATIFIIPGILPLVPGANTYYTMLAILDGDAQRIASVGTETVLMAGSIAVALLAAASAVRLLIYIFSFALRRIKT